MEYVLTSPMIITSRLMAGVKVGDAVISVEPIIGDGRRYTTAYYIDGPDGPLTSGQDFSVTLMAGETVERDLPRKAISVLLWFLGNDASGYRMHMGDGEPDHGYSFDAATAEWAYRNDSDIQSLAMDLDPRHQARALPEGGIAKVEFVETLIDAGTERKVE